MNTIGPKVHLTHGSISVAVNRLLEKGLVSRAESPDDRRVKHVKHRVNEENSSDCGNAFSEE